MRTKTPSSGIRRVSDSILAPLTIPASHPEIATPDVPDTAVHAETAPLTAVTGVVTEERSGVPLAGVPVRWVLAATSRKANGGGPREVGLAVTDGEGRFTIDLGADARSRDALCVARAGRRGDDFLEIVDERRRPVGKPVRITDGGREVMLHPPTGAAAEKPGPRQWKALAGWLTTNRLLLVRDLARQLARPYPDSPVADWPVTARGSVLRELAGIFDDDLLDQNAFVETSILAGGSLRRAVTLLKDASKFDSVHVFPDGIFPWLEQSDLSLYRDYLRGVWVAAAQRMYRESTTTTPAVGLLERQLATRFDQDFHTMDDAARPAAELLVPLLRTMLLRDTARGGFGLAAAAVPAQGTLSAEEYLPALVGASGVGARELRNRYRVSFDRLPGETTSPLQLNVEALLGLLADSYQSPEEPFVSPPPIVGQGKPLIFGPYVGRAPFFLQYEEWLDRQRNFYPENAYDIRKNLPVFAEYYRQQIAGEKAGSWLVTPDQGYFATKAERGQSAGWTEGMFAIVDTIAEGMRKLDAQSYPEALGKLEEARKLLWGAADQYRSAWIKDRFHWYWSTGSWNTQPPAGKHYPDSRVSLVDRARIKVATPEELGAFEAFFEMPYFETNSSAEHREKQMAKARTLYIYAVFYLHEVLLPHLRAAVYAAQGDHPRALQELAPLTGYRVGVADTASTPGYDPLGSPPNVPVFYRKTMLPYTTLVGFDDGAYTDLPPFHQHQSTLKGAYGRLALAPFEHRFFKLAQGEVMLAWADQLYRNDDPSSIRRARELYKGVLFLHGEDPDIAPDFPRGGPWIPGTIDPFWKVRENPAKVSQVTRARQGFFQIEQGLNVYGYRDDMVPLLRYRPLKLAADLFAASAKSAQTDFLAYMTRYEQALVELWQTQALVKKAQASGGIAAEHAAIAQVGVDKAKEQVAAVQAQIAAKQAEIADKDSFFEQWSDYLSGAKDALTGLVPIAQKVMAEDSAAGAVTGDQMLGIMKAGFSGGGAGAKDAAVSTLGSGAAAVIGFGVFAYASYTSMESMEEAAAKRGGDLKALQQVALPAAQAQVRLKERDVAIAKFEQQIAAADLELATTLLRFQQDRFLSAELWNKLTRLANRLMRRYVELGARAAWQAERALAFEQNRSIRVIRLDYLPAALRGVTGPDRLLADLAELEANRIQGIRLATPVKHTISVAREFPLQFGQLVKTGRCRFRTLEGDLRRAYPGTFAYRIRAITVGATDADGAPPRGILRNGGVSMVSNESLGGRVLVRFPDALALSEFRLHDDLFVYGLPGETLLQFEGSGYETDWELEFPAVANPKGLRSLTDVLITVDSLAYYSDAAAAAQTALAPPQVVRSIALAASVNDPQGLRTLAGTGGPARITFDPGKLGLPRQESGRKLTNLALICVGETRKNYSARLTATKSGTTAAFQIAKGIALSNAGPLLGTAAPLPLNALAGVDLDQPLALEIDRTGAGVADELKRLYDVALYLEYRAQL